MLTKNIKELKKQYKLTVLQLQYVQRAKLIINLGFSAREWAIFETFTKRNLNVKYNLATHESPNNFNQGLKSKQKVTR